MNNQDGRQDITKLDRSPDRRLVQEAEKSKQPTGAQMVYLVAKEIAREYLIKCTDEGYYSYNGKYWEEIGKLGFISLIRSLVVPEMTQRLVMIADNVRYLTYIGKIDPFYGAIRPYFDNDNRRAYYLVNEQNGVLFIDALTGQHEEKEHQADFMFTSILAVGYTPGLQPTNSLVIIKEILPNQKDRIVVYSFGAYGFFPNRRFQQGLYGYGEGENGKSTLVNMFPAVYGDTLVSKLKLSKLCAEGNTGDYAIASLKHKLINIGTEVDETHLGNSTNYKELVTDDIEGRQPFGRFEKLSNCWPKLANFGNHLPVFQKGGHADHRRINLILFPNKFDKNQRSDAEATILNEGAGWLNIFLKQCPLIIGQARLPSGSEASLLVKMRIMERTDPLNKWLQECCTFGDPSFETTSDELRASYRLWLDQQDISTSLAGDKMFRLLRDRYPALKKIRSNRKGERRKHTYQGIKIIKTLQDTEE